MMLTSISYQAMGMMDKLPPPMMQIIAINRSLSPRVSTNSMPKGKASKKKATLIELEQLDEEEVSNKLKEKEKKATIEPTPKDEEEEEEVDQPFQQIMEATNKYMKIQMFKKEEAV